MRYTQPQSGPITIDSSNPIARGIDVAFVRLDQPAVVGKGALAKGGSPTLITTKYGQGWFLGNSASDAFSTSNWPVLADGTEYTYLVVTQLTATGTTDYLVNGDNSSRAFQFRIETTGAPTLIGFNTAVATFAASGTPIPVGQVQAIAARSAATTVSIFQNGIKTATTAASGTIKGQTAGEIAIGNRGGLNLHGSIGLVIRWPRALSDAEAKAVTANPWQLFRSPQRVMLAAAGGGTSYSYTATGGFTLSGLATKVRGAGKTASGGIALSGAATKSRGAVRSTAGGIQLGGAASMTKGRSITTSGGLAISGAATILRRVARSAAGGLQLAGVASVTFFSAVQSRVVTPVGGIIFSGTAALVRRCTRLVSGGIQFGGTSPVVTEVASQAAKFNHSTIMRATITNRSVPARVTSISASSTMRSSFSHSTIMRISPLNATATMSDAAINRSANLL